MFKPRYHLVPVKDDVVILTPTKGTVLKVLAISLAPLAAFLAWAAWDDRRSTSMATVEAFEENIKKIYEDED